MKSGLTNFLVGMSQNTAFKKIAKSMGVYPYPRTRARHLMEIFQHARINCVFDVGAHYGEYGLFLRDAGFEGWILSFEPTSESYARLQEQAKGDPKWKTFNFALGASDSSQTMHIYKGSEFNSMLSPKSSNSEERFSGYMAETGTETISVRTLASAFEECTKGITDPRVFLKMDTQGYDGEVFRGALPMLDRIYGLQSELAGVSLYAEQSGMLSALSEYWDKGFKPTGFFVVNYAKDRVSVLEWDCVLMRVATDGVAAMA